MHISNNKLRFIKRFEGCRFHLLVVWSQAMGFHYCFLICAAVKGCDAIACLLTVLRKANELRVGPLRHLSPHGHECGLIRRCQCSKGGQDGPWRPPCAAHSATWPACTLSSPIRAAISRKNPLGSAQLGLARSQHSYHRVRASPGRSSQRPRTSSGILRSCHMG